MTLVACIGQGFVGGSLTTVLSEKKIEVYVYDKSGKVATGGSCPSVEHHYPRASLNSVVSNVTELVVACEQLDLETCSRGGGLSRRNHDHTSFTGVYFVCLPTPMKEDGSCDISIVGAVLDELASVPLGDKCYYCRGTGAEATWFCPMCDGKGDGRKERIAVVKSTVPPGSTERWNRKYSETPLRVVFNPEFLTEKNALNDMRNQDRIVLGGPRPHINVIKELFQRAFSQVPIVKTSSTTAEMVKYTTNCFLATKVAFANEMMQICEALGENGENVDYDKVIEYAKLDQRLGQSHWTVPGPDGRKGYGGSCLPKDLNSLIFLAKELGIDPKIMSATWEKNLEVRECRDWEQLVGRAVTQK